MKFRLLLMVVLASVLAGAWPAHAADPEPYVERYYDRSYRVFMASGNLPRARQVIENALYWRSDDERWWRRLAEVSRWLDDPETALKAWRQVAELSNGPQAWKHVLELAPLTYNNRLALQAHKALLSASPYDAGIIATIGRQYELLGQPEAGLRFFEQWRRSYPSKAVLREMQRLALNQGEDMLAAGYSREYMDRFGPEPLMAEQAADLYWLNGQREKALLDLNRDANQLPYIPALSRRIAVMAGELGEWDLALSRYQELVDNEDDQTDDLYNYITLSRYYQPERLALLMGRAWRKNGDPQLALGALYQLQSRGDDAAIDAFLKGLSAEQRQRLEQTPEFLRFYANLQLHRGDADAAQRWLNKALVLNSEDRETRISWMWLLIATGQDTALQQALVNWEDSARIDRRYWNVLAASQMALGNAEQSLRYEIELLKTARDNWERQWYYSQALIASGRNGQAWPVMRRLKEQLPFTVEPQQQATYRDMKLTLSLLFDDGDTTLKLAQAQIDGMEDVPAAHAEWLAQWAIGQSEPGLAQSWYLRKKIAQQGPLKAGSALAYALVQGDLDSVARTREQYLGQLSLSEQLEAHVRLDEPRQAANTFMAIQAGAPELAGSNNLQESLLLPTALSSQFHLEQRRLGALDIQDLQFVQYHPISDFTQLSVEARQRNFSSNDDELLQISDDEQRLSVALAYQRERFRSRLKLGQRNLLNNSETMADLELGANWTQYWSGSLNYQWRTPADESSLLILGASRTGSQWLLNWRPSSTWQSSVDWANYDYHDLNESDLGSGSIINAQSTWRPWLSRFSPGVRVRHTRADFTAGGDSMAQVRALLPPGAQTLPLPQDYHESEIVLLLGQPDVHIRAHRLQGWGEIGYSENSLSGAGFTGRFGVEGPLIGRDEWKIYAEQQLNSGGSDEDSYRFGLQYRIYY
jgi:predicted Zn-dependent protease